MSENLPAIQNVCLPFELLIQRQAANAAANHRGVPVDAFVQLVFSDKANNDAALPTICPTKRDPGFPGRNPNCDMGLRLDTRDQRMQAMHMLANLAFDGLINKERYRLDATLQIRRANSDEAIDYVVTISQNNGQRVSGENQLGDDETDWTL
jgi:hypothetical protein